MGKVEDPVAAPLENLNFVVEPFHKTTVVPIEEVVRDLLQPLIEGLQEAVVTPQTAGPHLLLPVRELLRCLVFGQLFIEEGRQLLPLLIGFGMGTLGGVPR